MIWRSDILFGVSQLKWEHENQYNKAGGCASPNQTCSSTITTKEKKSEADNPTASLIYE
jgi:hypothetical protein